MVGRYLSCVLYSATVLRFGHCVMWLVGTCLVYCIVLQSSGLDIVCCGWRGLVFHAVQCYSLQVWWLCDVVGRYLPSMLYSAAVLRIGHYVMWLAGTGLPYCTVLQSSGLVTMWCGWQVPAFHIVQCYSLQVWSLCDVVGRHLPCMLYSAAGLRFGQYVMWLVSTCHPYCLVSQL